MENITEFKNLIVPIVLTIPCVFFRVRDCLDCKRSFVSSSILSIFILSINWIVAFSLFYGFSLLGIYLEGVLPFVPFFLYWAYFIFSFVSFLYLFSEFYKFGHKFYQNFRDEGIFSSKKKDYTNPGEWH